jgi:hypothetical protein
MVTCYDEVNAIDIAMTSLRHFYPDAPIYLFCEKDEKTFLSICNNHGIGQGWSEDTQSDLLKLNDSNYSSEDYNKVERAIQVFLKRVNLVCLDSNIEYLCLHCPDTLIRGKIDIPEGSGLLGSCVNKYFPEKLNKVLLKHGGAKVEYFGAVPAILNVVDFQKSYEKILSEPALIRELAKASCYAFSHDILMSILFSLIGKKEEYNPQIVECGRNPNWIDTDCSIVHQFRTFYPKRKTKYKSQEDA